MKPLGNWIMDTITDTAGLLWDRIADLSIAAWANLVGIMLAIIALVCVGHVVHQTFEIGKRADAGMRAAAERSFEGVR